MNQEQRDEKFRANQGPKKAPPAPTEEVPMSQNQIVDVNVYVNQGKTITIRNEDDDFVAVHPAVVPALIRDLQAALTEHREIMRAEGLVIP